ncbi:DUF2868 domain-containing protein [Desulfococcus sp.]|uniref:DUF2868 domain-containing protein n=1 Tax=Desulfococcus sp. TaxID=2025834 RepID=UPI0035933254
MKTPWRYSDLIDLEYFFHEDETADETTRRANALRDREIYVRHILPRTAPGKPVSRRWLLRQWLDRRRASLREGTVDAFLPGDAFGEMYRLLVLAAAVFGVVSGGGLAFSLLRYAGTSPVNVSVYLSLLVGTQLFIIALLLAGALIRLAWRRKAPSSAMASLLSAILVSLTLRLRREAAGRMSGRSRMSLEAITGLIRGRRRIYGSLFYWPFFILTQAMGISFNAGVLGATLLRVLGTDVAFGWQSSVLFSADMVHRAVEAVALPWSWFLPPHISHPTLTQIEGSHMVLKDGIYHLATQDLVSWWPFLCLAVLFYGLIPRLIFLAMGILFKSSALAGLDFSHSLPDQLIQRMETPLLDTGGGPQPERPEASETAPAPPAGAPEPPDGAMPQRRLVALIPEDLFDDCGPDELEALISRVFGSRIRETLKVDAEETGDLTLLAHLAEAARKNGRVDVFLLREAWQPPILEDLAFIRSLRQAVGERARIQLGLIGRPTPDTIFTRVMETDWNIWHQKIASLGDPFLRIERLVRHEA